MNTLASDATTTSDSAAGASGVSVFDGGGGIDTVIMGGVRANFQITVNQDSRVMTVIGAANQHRLSGFERLHFTDVAVAFDIDGNAGTVARILSAVYGTSALHNRDYVGYGLSLIDTGHYDSAQLTQLALEKRLGTNPDHGQVVDLLYTNVFGAAPPQAIREHFVGMLDSGQHTIASLGLLAAQSAQNLAQVDLVGLGITGLEYQYFPPA